MRPRRGDSLVGEVQARAGAEMAPPEIIAELLGAARQRGYSRLVTTALEPHETDSFTSAGFSLLEDLCVLALELEANPHSRAPIPEGIKLTKMWPWRRRGALKVDSESFDNFWRLDEHTLRDAERATLRSRSRVAMSNNQVVGYCVTGGSSQQGYVQRLAVMPRVEGQGVGRALLEDGLDWLATMGTPRVLVNTQRHNERALRLYQHRGFKVEPYALSVLEISLAEAPS